MTTDNLARPLGAARSFDRIRAGLSNGRLIPGIVIATVVAGCAYSSRTLPGVQVLSPMIVAVVVGMTFANVVGVPDRTRPGIAFCQRSLLRWAIVLLGLQVTIGQIAMIGPIGLGIVAVSLTATFAFTLIVARAIGVKRRLAELIAAGTAICGASAIVATSSITRGDEEDVAYSVAAITLFGTVAMLAFPALGGVFALDQHQFGLWSGAAIHEVAQVVGAGFQYGDNAGDVSVIAKLSRVAMLAPMMFAIAWLARLRGSDTAATRAPVPWFVVAFVGMVLVNSAVAFSAEFHHIVATLTTFMLTIGLAALGLQSNFSRIRAYGLRPLVLAFLASLFIGGLSLGLVKLLG